MLKSSLVMLVLVVGFVLVGCGSAEPQGYLVGDESPAAKEAMKKEAEKEKAADAEEASNSGAEENSANEKSDSDSNADNAVKAEDQELVKPEDNTAASEPVGSGSGE